MHLLIITFVAIGISAVSALPGEYTTKYDNVDLEQILNNDRLLKAYTHCLLNKGSCTPDGAELKKIVPDALSDACAKCNDKQKAGSRRVLTFLIDNKPEIYAELEKSYDATGAYKTKYCEFAKNEGIAVKNCV